MKTEVSGTFVKIGFASEVEKILLTNEPNRPAGRFNRTGQDALYLGRSEQSARVALTKYLKNDDPPRVLIEFELEECQLIDLRSADAIQLLESSRSNWLDAYNAGKEAESWLVADQLRQQGCYGLIDPSRQCPDTYHVVLFNWNQPTGPRIMQKGKPKPIEFR